MLTYKRLRELLNYDPETGIFTWRFSLGRIKAGKVSGSLRPNGYIQIRVDGNIYRAHRLAWLYMTGNWPADQLDHINGKRADNRFINLREADGPINSQNRRKALSASGLMGVYKNRRSRCFPWMVRIGIPGGKRKSKYLGRFATPEEAHQAYLKAKRELHPGCTI